MASYTSTLSSNSNYDVTLNVNQTSQNIGANTSNISWSLVVRKKSGSGYWANDSNASTFSVKIDGVTVSSGQKSYNFTSSTPQSITVASGTRTITHGADGSKSIACSASWKDNKNGLGTGSPSGTLALTTIPRATQPTVSSTTVALGSSITINLPRASSSFTHRIYYNFFSATGLTGGIGNSTNATTSTTFTPPAGLASSYMKNTTSNGAVIYVETRNGSTVIGTKSIAVSITVPNNSTYNPTLTAPTFSEQNSTISSGVSGIWVQGHSKIRVASTASLKYSATASSVRVYIGGAWRPAKISGSTVTISSDYVPTTSGTHSVTVELTDSRGRKATSSGSLVVTAYSKPKLTVSAERNGSESKYITVTAKLDITTLSSKNLGTMELYIRQKGATSWGTVVKRDTTTSATLNWGTLNFGNYSDILSYEVLVQAKDKLTGFSTFFSSISTATVLMDAYKDVGVSFGKMYEPAKGGSVQIGGDMTVDGAVVGSLIIGGTAGSKPLRTRGIEGTNGAVNATGTIDGDLYLNYNSKLTVNTGGNLNVAGGLTIDKDANFRGNTALSGSRMTFANNTQLYWNDTGGTGRRVLHKGTDNWIHINPDANGGTHLYGQVRSQGDLLSTTNSNLGLEGYRWGTVWTSGHGQPSTSNTTSAVGLGFKGGNSLMTMGIGSATNDRNGWIQVRHSENSFSTTYGNLYLQKLGGTTYTGGNFTVSGSKNAVHVTRDGARLTPAYETAESYLGDIGEDTTGHASEVKVDIEVLFQDTVNTEIPYQVFLQSYGNGHIWVSERNKDYFIVKSSSPNIPFAWELKAKRRGYENDRLVLSEIGFEEMQVLEGLHGGYSKYKTPEGEKK